MSDIPRAREVEGTPSPTGPFAWTVSWGGLVFVSGVRGLDPESGQPAPTDEERLELIFQHLDRLLTEAGSSVHRVLASRVYLTDMSSLRPLVNRAYEEFFGDHLPTRTIVEVTALNQGDSIEVEVVAATSVR